MPSNLTRERNPHETPTVTKNALWTAFKYLLAFGVLFLVVYWNWESSDGKGGLREVWHRPIHGTYLLLAFVLHVAGLTATLLRWYLLVRAVDLPFTIFGALKFGTLGLVCNAFLPGAVGGDLVRATAIARGQSRQTIAVATVIMDRAMSLWGLIFVVAVVGSACWLFDLLDSAALSPAEVIILTADIIVAASGLAWCAMGWFPINRAARVAERLSRVPRIGGSLSQLWQAVWLYRGRPASIFWALVLTTFSNVCDILTFYCYAMTLWDGAAANPLPGLSEHFLIVPMGLVVSGVPLFPGGAGIGEAGYGGLYELFGSAPANGILGSLLFRVSGWVIGIVGYLLCLVLDTSDKPPGSTSGSA
jgi:glycosyltransferase 2 family protein